MVELPFLDRAEAGCLLGSEVAARDLGVDPIVLALPRGGVAVGAAVAKALNAPLDIVAVRKLGVPCRPELTMGAMAGETRVLDYQLLRELGVSYGELQSVVSRETKELARLEMLYRGWLPAPVIRGRTVVLVDDGLATGSTMVAATRHVRSLHPGALVVAVPVGSAAACLRISLEADECICLAQSKRFSALSDWYVDFPRLTDEEVQEILERTLTH